MKKIILFFAYSFSIFSFCSDIQVTTIKDLLKSRPDIEYMKCHDAEPFHYQPFEISKYPEFQPHQGLFSESFILKIPNGSVGSHMGWIKVDGAFVQDCMEQHWSLATRVDMLENRPFKNVTHIPGKVAVITMLFDSCYSHWMYNVLGRLALLEMNNIEYDWLFVACDKPFMKKTLELWGVDPSKIIQPFNETKYIVADELIVPSHVGIRIPLPHQYPLNWIPLEQYCTYWNINPKNMSLDGRLTNPKIDTPLPDNVSIQDYFLSLAPLCSIYFQDWIVDFIRNKFLRHIESETYNFSKKIFISRADTPIRKMLNEDDVFAHFERQGYQKHVLSKMTITEQVALFHNAESIVAAHGTGLINLMFCKPGTEVIEIFQGRSDCSLYYLSQILQLKYHYIQTMDFETIEGQEDSTVPLFLIKDFIGQRT